ncbi:sulfotransferase family protein [Glycomyces harbinensis]|uniref:Sulfotransferase family protein n=1 Tax=Glycomyces harbinensis TaxID=58114 RepID=A0A1G6YPK9_9ACTN|nr:sulfotransferase [Glycomyces harbinensis]SDD92328.1 Sulfotransferase family protein [Glycomyces harbinensis]
MRRMVLNAALGRAAKDRRDPGRALALWRERAAVVAAAADTEPDADDAAFVEDLGFTLQCFARVPELTPLGWTVQLRSAEERLANRLRVKWIHSQNPLVADEPIERPVFVVGLPRTASSLVHRILSASEPHRGPLLWELQRTGLGRDAASADRSRRAVERQVARLTALAPAYDAMHPLRADRPEESIAVMWRTYFPLSCAVMPDYRAWLEQADVTADYEYLRQVLQVLQYGRERRRWILKFPGHVAHLDVIRQVFPGAVFVWTHRDPVAAVGSFCALVEALAGVHCRRVDPVAVGRLWLGVLAESIDRGRKLRRALPADAVADVSSHRIVADPHRYAPKLFERLGVPWTFADRMGLDAIAGVPDGGVGPRRDLSRYGLGTEEVEEAFGDYGQEVADLRG